MKSILKNLAMAAAGGAFAYGAQLAIGHTPDAFAPIVTTAIAAAAAHWFPQPHAEPDPFRPR